jgi:hypothetical protein
MDVDGERGSSPAATRREKTPSLPGNRAGLPLGGVGWQCPPEHPVCSGCCVGPGWAEEGEEGVAGAWALSSAPRFHTTFATVAVRRLHSVAHEHTNPPWAHTLDMCACAVDRVAVEIPLPLVPSFSQPPSPAGSRHSRNTNLTDDPPPHIPLQPIQGARRRLQTAAPGEGVLHGL